MNALHIGLMLNVRTIVTAFALIFALMVLVDTRRIFRIPWAFWFIATRIFLTLTLRTMMGLEMYVDIHVIGAIYTANSFLDLFTLIAMWLGYGTVFSETPLRRWIRNHWLFK